MKVTHKLTGESMTIIKDYGSVCVCSSDKYYNIPSSGWKKDNKYICLKSNLIYDNQLKLL